MIRVHLPYSKGYHVKKSPIALNLKAKPCIIGIDQKTAKKKIFKKKKKQQQLFQPLKLSRAS